MGNGSYTVNHTDTNNYLKINQHCMRAGDKWHEYPDYFWRKNELGWKENLSMYAFTEKYKKLGRQNSADLKQLSNTDLSEGWKFSVTISAILSNRYWAFEHLILLLDPIVPPQVRATFLSSSPCLVHHRKFFLGILSCWYDSWIPTSLALSTDFHFSYNVTFSATFVFHV